MKDDEIAGGAEGVDAVGEEGGMADADSSTKLFLWLSDCGVCLVEVV